MISILTATMTMVLSLMEMIIVFVGRIVGCKIVVMLTGLVFLLFSSSQQRQPSHATKWSQGKIKILENSRSTRLKPRLNPKIKRKNVTKMNIDDGEFQQQSTQRFVDINKYTSGRNDRWVMRLKLIQEEYYSIGNRKS